MYVENKVKPILIAMANDSLLKKLRSLLTDFVYIQPGIKYRFRKENIVNNIYFTLNTRPICL